MTRKQLKEMAKTVHRELASARTATELENLGRAYMALSREYHRRVRTGEG